MRSIQFILLLTIFLVFMVVIQEVSSFTVIRPKPSLIKTKTLTPSASYTPGETTSPTQTGTRTPGNSFNTPGGGTAPSPTVSAPPASPEITPSPDNTAGTGKNKFPAFVLTISILLVIVVVFWYLTRNVNFKRLFKQYFS